MTNARHKHFLALLEPVLDRLGRYALAVYPDSQDAEDLVSDTVLIAFEKFDELREPDRFFHFLLKIASRLAKRRKFRERRRDAYDPAIAEALIASVASPELAAEVRIVQDALLQLPERMRETVVLFDVSDLSLDEIRQIQGGTLSGVKTRLKRGREKLVKLLGATPQQSSHEHGRRELLSDMDSVTLQDNRPEMPAMHLALATEIYEH